MHERIKEEAVCGKYSHCLSYYLNAVIDVSKAVQREIQLDDILSVIIESTAGVMDADRCTVFVYDDEKRELWSYVGRGLSRNEIRFSIDFGIAGYVARELALVNIPDAYLDPRFNTEFDKKSGYRTRSILCHPLVDTEKRLIGVIQVINKKSGLPFDENDEMLIGLLAAQVQLSIERAILTEQIVEHKKEQEMLTLASEIQSSALPKDFSISSQLDIYAFIAPSKEVGGDFYDFHFIDEDLFCFTVGDVSDKGVPAALFMMMIKTLFHALSSKFRSPALILDAISREVVGNNHAMMFVTMGVGILDTGTGGLTYSSAGHTPPYIVSSAGDVRELDIEPSAAIGLFDGIIFKDSDVTLNAGDAVFLFTDGVDEAKDSDGRMFSLKRVRDSLASVDRTGARTMTDGVISDVMRFADGAPQSDDITILTIRFTGNKDYYELSVPAVMESLRDILDFTVGILEGFGFDEHQRFDVQVAVDEACTNIITHGTDENDEKNIDIKVERNNTDFVIIICNVGAAYTPDMVEAPVQPTSIEEMKIGGLGLYFIQELMDEVSYTHNEGINILTMIKRMGSKEVSYEV